MFAIIIYYKYVSGRENKDDHTDHYMVYNALGFTDQEGYEIDYQQNVGRLAEKGEI